jgi:hypothetical protein
MEELQCWNICLLGFSQNEEKRRGEKESKGAFGVCFEYS